MAKCYTLVDAQGPTPKKACIINWKLCMFCQDHTNSDLQCPARTTKTSVVGYKTLEEQLVQFEKLGHVPMSIDIKSLDDGGGIEATMIKHQACWHKSCRLKFNQTKLDRLRKKVTHEKSSSQSECMQTRAHCDPADVKATCFFCDEPAGSAGLHNASTYDIDSKVRKCALELNDTALLAKLSPGDMMAIEAKYHSKCLVALYNRAARSNSADDNGESDLHGIAFAELVAYIEEFRSEKNIAPVFKLADLAQLYKARLGQLGVVTESRIHTSRLKLRLLSVFPDIRAHLEGRSVILSFDNDIGGALRKACDHDGDRNAMCLVQAAKIVRKEMFNNNYSFDGSFTEESQQNVVPQSLLALVSMILEGPNIECQSQLINRRAPRSISQLLMFNSVKHKRATDSSSTVRHNQDHDMPLPLYISLKIHAVTRSRNLIDTLFDLGICCSYDRLLNLTSEISRTVSQQYSADGVVCPLKLNSGLFTTAAVDNIDYNPTSATAKESFHGTGISLIQHPSYISEGSNRHKSVICQSAPSSRSVAHLPSEYTSVAPASIRNKSFIVPCVDSFVQPTNVQKYAEAKVGELAWRNEVMKSITKEQLDKMQWISWSAYHASIQDAVVPPPAIIALLPLFVKNANSIAMIKHTMTIVQAAVAHLNPGQVPVLAADQPLFALAKQIQWTWSSVLGENYFIIMFGGLHIEMAVLKVLGDWLDGSGWINALVQASIASSGTADSFIKACHVTKTRHAHQVTAASIHILLQHAYDEYKLELDANAEMLSLEQWCQVRSQQSIQFYYWWKTLSLETMMLLYVRSLREGNFKLYLECLMQIVPWMFALDHTHYSRWLPIHIRDMSLLPKTHPAVFAEFCNGKFVVQKTQNSFSCMAIDQCHEQNNADVKGSTGGAIGLMTNPVALERWMVTGPEVARMVTEFESLLAGTKSSDHRHHEQHSAVQATFLKEVKSLVSVFEEMGNPFLEQSNDLLVLDTKDILDASVAEAVRKVEALGVEQYQKFVEERLVKCEKPVTDVISKNNLPLLKHTPSKGSSKQKMQIEALKSNCNLFSRLYVSCQARSGNLDMFFSHENQAAPPSLSLGGKLRHGTKADLLDCLSLDEKRSTNMPAVDATFIDGAAAVQMMHPGTAKTFQDYADAIFLPYISKYLETAERVDVVWDTYIRNSLKASTRERRGKGIRRRVSATTLLPQKWDDFLRVAENKTELFKFLSGQVKNYPVHDGKVLFATNEEDAVSTMVNADMSNLAPCSQEEADTRLLLHVLDAVQKGSRKLMVRTVDTDVVVLGISKFHQISPDELWMAFGTKSNYCYLPIHEIVGSMDPKICTTLPVFHAFTGCDTVSAFGGRGKKTAWKVWQVFPDVTDAFEHLLLMENDISESTLSVLERYVVLLYDRTSGLESVNDARKWLFTKKSRTLENIPPTQAALKQHVKRASYQANCWNKALIRNPELPSPGEWGWCTDTAGWHPLWTTLPEASESCHELIRCGCKKGCNNRCKCVKAALKCTPLCHCNGAC